MLMTLSFSLSSEEVLLVRFVQHNNSFLIHSWQLHRDTFLFGSFLNDYSTYNLQVRLCREKKSGNIYAMKKLQKSEMVIRGQVKFVNNWITASSFTDKAEFLVMVFSESYVQYLI